MDNLNIEDLIEIIDSVGIKYLPNFLIYINNRLKEGISISTEVKLKLTQWILKWSFSSQSIDDDLYLETLQLLDPSLCITSHRRKCTEGISIVSHDRGTQGTSTQIVQQGSGKYANVISEENVYSKKFKSKVKRIRFQIKHSDQNGESMKDWLVNAFEEILKRIQGDTNRSAKVGLTIALPENPEIVPVWIGMKTFENLKAEQILDALSAVSQSNREFLSTEVMQIEAVINDPNYDGGRV